MRAVSRPLLSLLVAVSFFGTGCSTFLGEGTERSDLVRMLDEQTDLDSADVNCIADTIFDDPGLTPDQIRDFTLGEYDEQNDRYQEYLSYQEVVDSAVKACIG